jgi:2-haloacid dehalogenase
MKPEVAVFDLGKVLLDFDYMITARQLADDCDVSAEGLLRLIDQTRLLLDYEEGKTTTDEFYSEVCRQTGYRSSFEKFRDAFAGIFAESPAMVSLHARLKSVGIPCFIFSNTNEIAIHHVRRKFPFFAKFDGYVFSYEHKSMKPDARLYECVEEATGRSGAAIIYIDDRAENIAAAKPRGWQTVHHTAPELSIAAFESLGLLEEPE